MPIFFLSSNQWTGIIVSSSLAVGFSKSLITSLTNLAGYPDRMKDCLIVCTSSCQFVAIRFAVENSWFYANSVTLKMIARSKTFSQTF